MRFPLDENVHRRLAPFLRERSHDVTLSPKGLSNGRVLAFPIPEKRIPCTEKNIPKPLSRLAGNLSGRSQTETGTHDTDNKHKYHG